MIVQQKLVLFFADPQISDAEFASFKLWLATSGLSTILGDAEEIRAVLRSYQPITKTRERRKESPIGGNFVSEISQLLRADAGLTASEALRRLQETIAWEGKLPDKKSFAEGVTRLGEILGQSAVLSAAHQLKNSLAHNDSGLAWPLRHE